LVALVDSLALGGAVFFLGAPAGLVALAAAAFLGLQAWLYFRLLRR
jgi:hypothetical protein